MEIMTTTAVYENTTMDLSDGNSFFWGDELNKSLKIMSLTIFSLVFVLGVLGNGVVIWVTGFKMKKTTTTVWYLNLAVADFLLTAFLPLRITKTALDNHWPFGKFMCKLNHTILYMNMFASIYILMAISVYRCVCVVCPVWAQNHRSVRKVSCVSLGVWVLALAISSPYFIFMDTFHDDKDIIRCLSDFALTDDYSPQVEQLEKFRFGAMIITCFLMGFVVPFTVIVSCYSVIIYRLRMNRSLASHSGRPFKIIAAVIIAFFLCWAPLHIMELILLVNVMVAEHSETVQDNIVNIGLPIAICLAFLNSCLNPLLYVFMGQDFKAVFRRSILKVLEKAFTEELPLTTNSGATSYSKYSFSEAHV